MKHGCNTNVSITKYDMTIYYCYQKEILKRYANFEKKLLQRCTIPVQIFFY